MCSSLVLALSLFLFYVCLGIHNETGCETVEFYVLDLEDFSSVKAFTDRFESEGGGRLDILLENAGVSLMDLSFTKDGWETS